MQPAAEQPGHAEQAAVLIVSATLSRAEAFCCCHGVLPPPR